MQSLSIKFIYTTSAIFRMRFSGHGSVYDGCYVVYISWLDRHEYVITLWSVYISFTSRLS